MNGLDMPSGDEPLTVERILRGDHYDHDDELLTLEELAAVKGIDERELHKHIALGLPYYVDRRPGHQWDIRSSRNAINRWYEDWREPSPWAPLVSTDGSPSVSFWLLVIHVMDLNGVDARWVALRNAAPREYKTIGAALVLRPLLTSYLATHITKDPS